MPIAHPVRPRILASVLAAALAAWPVAAAAAGGTFLPFLDGPDRDAPRTRPPLLSVSVGGRPVRAVMDTGSTGLVIAARLVPDWPSLPSLGPARLTYSSSGRVMEGRWVVARVTVAGADGASVETEPMPVMAVTRVGCLRRARHCTPEERPRDVAMLGVGFARQADHQAQSTPDHNPFLRLSTVRAGAARPGYVVTRRGVWAGLGDPADQAGFLTVRLGRSTEFADWAPPPACLSVATHAPPACGTVLVDTGVSRMYLTVPPAQLDGALADHRTLRAGTQVGVQLSRIGDPPWGYTFRTGDRADPAAPAGITLVAPGKRPPFVNTSVHFLNRFDYLFDAGEGLVGYRARE